MIIGAEFQTASPAETPALMNQLVDNLEYRLESSESDDEKLIAVLDTHIQFERIHPFSDGNGRTGRMIMNYSLLQQGFPPLIIEKEQNRMQAFQNMAQEQIEDE
ncbi:Fic family protein [Aerococcus urinaeequi]|uniref:Fic family protein n=1 Tax=Aerococcus urinaeequi TaxID=51665 RepID=UPI003D6BCEB2